MTSVPPRSTYGEDQVMVLEQQSPEGGGQVERMRQEINQSRTQDAADCFPARTSFPQLSTSFVSPEIEQIFAKATSNIKR